MIFPISTRSPTRNSAKTARSEKLSKMNGLPSASDQNGFEFANSQIRLDLFDPFSFCGQIPFFFHGLDTTGER
jgi:hypothetical protein